MPSVCYVLAEYPVLSQTFVHAEMVALRRLGVDVHVATLKAGTPVRFGDGPEGEPFHPVHVGMEGLAACVARFDHLHTHFADVGVRILAPIAARARLPWSATAHAYDLFRRDAAVRADEWRRADMKALVAISRFHKRFVCTRGVDPGRVAVIPNAARLPEAPPSAPSQLRKVLAVGRPVAKKGFPTLLHAWARCRASCPDMELEIIGGEGLVASPPEGLKLTPMIPYAETIDRMSRADLVVAPSIVAPDGDMDGIPTVLVEAGALRRPVISTPLSGIPDLVVDGVNGLLVPPGDVDALAAALRRLYLRPSELTRLGLAGPMLAAAHDANVVAARLRDEVFWS